MNKLQKLQAAVEKALKDMADAEAAFEAETEDAKRLILQKALDAARETSKKAVTELEAEVKKAEEMKVANDLIAKSKALGEVDVTGKSLTGKAGAEAIDRVADEAAHLCIVHKYLTNKRGLADLSGQEVERVIPKSSKWEAGANGVKLPLSTCIKMLGHKWARSVGYSPSEIVAAMKSVMTSASDPLGGFTVPQEFVNRMIEIPVEPPHIIDRATVIPCTTGELTIPRAQQKDGDEFGGMEGAWISEAGLKNATDTQFEQAKIATYEYAMYTQVSLRLLARSAIAMENWIVTKGRQKALDALDSACISGNGSGKPTGILQTAGIRTVKRDAASQVSYNDLVRVKYAVKPYHRAGGTFVIDDTVAAYLEGTKDSYGRPLFTPSVANGIYDRLIGYPYIVTTRTPDLGTKGDVFFSDLREYYIAMEQEVVAKRSDDYDIVHNVATIVIFLVAGGEMVEPRVVCELGNIYGS